MDAPVVPDHPEPAPSDVPPLSKSLRSSTTPPDFENTGSSGPSNGRSSVDSASDKQLSQAGDADSTKTGSTGLSKLLASRRNRKKKKKESLKLVDELPTTLEADGNDRKVPGITTHKRASSTSLLPTESNSTQDDTSNLLTDDSEPDR